ncbi:uracil nucleotide/cysteinyl leukotriene receptor-like [Pimephales promelas]|uniref:uracil nucleotide/cysteinyl leukotriene receptor-like n=1 Tax=Pimephales promelas TaxID=90988 RepID=UPI001955AD05|nr:uracil nucleotide/cysteinyl leukotriene receptor-like [Pimephales promelas]
MTNFSTPANITLTPFWKIDIVETCMLTFHFISGLPTNVYVMWLIMTGTGSGVASEFFNLNLSVCGIFVSVNGLLILVSKWFPFQSLTALTQFFYGLTVTGHPLFQCLICVERHLAVVHPVTFLKYKPLRYRVICCTVVWIYIFGTCLFCMFIFISYTIHMYIWFCSLQFLLFLSIQLFCLVAVLRALKQSGPGESRGVREEENQMKRKAFYIIRVTTASLVVTYVPFIATGLHFIVTLKFIQILWSISYICFMLAGFVHPALYLHRTGKLFCFCSKN